MKINITVAELNTVDLIITALKSENITATEQNIKTEVLNKDGKWVDFHYEKVRFTYCK